MDTRTLSAIVYTLSRKDIFQGRGRIILSDFKKTIGEPNLTAQEVIDAFKTFYPQYKIEQRTENVILIHFEIIKTP